MASKFMIEIRAPSITPMPTPELADLLIAIQRMNNAVPLKKFTFSETAVPGIFNYDLETVDGRHFTQTFDFTTNPSNPAQYFSLLSSTAWSLTELAPQRVVRDACINARVATPGLTLVHIDWKD